MGHFNPRSPDISGSEFQPSTARRITLNSPLEGIAQRIRPGAVTITRLHPLLRAVEGTPGLALEVLTTLTPTIEEDTYLPGTDTGKVTTGWQDASAGAVNYTDVDTEYHDGTNYATNTSAQSASASLDMQFRGNNAGDLGTDRVLYVRVGAEVKLRDITGNAREVEIAARLVLNGTGYLAAPRHTSAQVQYDRKEFLHTWYLNPATGLPWTTAEADDIIDAADADTFGVRVKGRLAATGFRVAGMWAKIGHCAENRIGSVYTADAPRRGWIEQVLSATSAASANTFYWLHLYALNGSASDWLQVGMVKDPALIVDTDPADIGEARQLVHTTLSGQGGVPTATVERPGQMWGILAETGAGIHAESQPYSDIDPVFLDSFETRKLAQQVTTPNPTATFGSIQLTVEWADPTTRPDQPLVVEVRTGAGAETGGGTLKATGTLRPDQTTAGPAQYLVELDAPFAASVSTLHHLLVSSTANPLRGWKMWRLDSRSDLVTTGGGTTASEVQNSTQGGTIDSYVVDGTPDDRYDLPMAMVATAGGGGSGGGGGGGTSGEVPAAPASLYAVGFHVSGTAPGVYLTWAATSVGATFGAYRIYRRPTRAVARPWHLIAEITPRDIDDPADFEAGHLVWIDQEAGWVSRLASTGRPGGPWDDGWDYAVTVLDASSGLESAVGDVTATGVQVEADTAVWLTCNSAPWLNTPLERAARLSSDSTSRTRVFEVAGRDDAVARTRAERPVRRWRLGWRHLGWRSEDAARVHQAAALSGRQMALLTSRGDRAYGVLSPPGFTHDTSPVLPTDAELVVTGADSAVAGDNFPGGLILNGTTQYASTPDAASLDPGSGAFTVVVCAAQTPFAGSAPWAAKMNAATTAGWMLVTTSTNTLAAYIYGVSDGVAMHETNADWFDGAPHVAIFTSTGTAQAFYRDGVLVDSDSVTHGAVSNSDALQAGGWTAGPAYAPLSPLRGWAYYPRALDATEALHASRYLLGFPAYRMPAGPTCLYHLADDRCWDGVSTSVTDLSGNGHTATLVGSPLSIGVPWRLSDLSRGET